MVDSVEGIGPRRFYRLLSQYGDARGVWDNIGDEGMAFLGPKLRKQLRAARSEEYFFRLLCRHGAHGHARRDPRPPRAIRRL